ncbi:MAG: SMC-Scp complex subunit ScpB [Ignavibacteria bacterium GWB2_35_12]|nr:MAG: SMC-Scp complex subunit ScpB [Ignavibacteria bacterium GWA2_35_8]OGU38655.1 MAG: SMC-Scp complex subunit ScpB [Ignavibacteria bacterium GWB2_35_12]OGU88151.1 MAG: SMC-Scp complex subunit ScpB [Ignavibacteria bacterium RIFOXYA2_FULL_35_10]OGV21944.1 MAG: SMC-Scp complex subunit ScpB [Ignavibacteria bacterium RIFOXYC2_FULL_35_21]
METINKQFLNLSRNEQKAVIEALLFSSEEPMPPKVLYRTLVMTGSGFSGPKPETTPEEAKVNENQISLAETVGDEIKFCNDDLLELINEINTELVETNRPFQIVNLAGGYVYSTRPEYGMLLQQVIKSKIKKRLSHAALETLAIIAYRQPVTKPEIEQVRGVNSIDVVNSLIEKGLVEIVGRKDVLGKPLLYATTQDFLKTFGLKDLEELPKLRELEEFSLEQEEPESHIEIVVDKNLEETYVELPASIKDSVEINEIDDEVYDINT